MKKTNNKILEITFEENMNKATLGSRFKEWHDNIEAKNERNNSGEIQPHNTEINKQPLNQGDTIST